MVINPHNRSASDYSISFQGALLGARYLKSSNRFTAYSIYPIELKFDRLILDISPHNRSKLDFSISLQGALWGRASCKLQIDSQPTVFMRLS